MTENLVSGFIRYSTFFGLLGLFVSFCLEIRRRFKILRLLRQQDFEDYDYVLKKKIDKINELQDHLREYRTGKG